MNKPRSPIEEVTFRSLVGDFVAAILLPVWLLKYKGFWGLRVAALSHGGGGVIDLLYRRYSEKFNAYVPLSAKIKGPLCLPHGLNGIFISADSVVGSNVTIFQQVTIGEDTLRRGILGRHSPIIGDNCYIGAGAKIIGGVTIGDNCRIGANCCVYFDMPANSVAVCGKTRLIQRRSCDNRFLSRSDTRFYFNNGEWVLNDESPSCNNGD